ncbi:Rrf2 family transcriptional regulator [Thalassococcus profundi]|uniref:Rrf2 family transcriptional regulator n=1 Tax=Thalassococcus profundi TaxID=2282382 RepID=A0A369TLB1_9RHOB|nr:Rrf2 family transcriptional regulator [Thalassococcus profundi]RDD65612.1 Rrf2 family transcriptional regulator [Thalassococcus profundi]
MRVTKRTDIAMRVLMYCAVHADKLVTKSEIATACNASGNHVAQIINQLAQLGFLNTRRGRHGGLSLAGPASGISVGAVFRAVEGPVPLAECFADSGNACPLSADCRLRAVLSKAAEAFYATLDPVTVEELVSGNAPLLKLLSGGAEPERDCGEVLVSAAQLI